MSPPGRFAREGIRGGWSYRPRRGPNRMDAIVLTTFTLATVAAHAGGPGFGFGWILFLVIPFLFLLAFAIMGAFARRRWMRHGGDWGHGYGYGHGAPGRSAEVTLAERFAQGDIDEKEYRARLEVLRASNPTPPAR